MDTNTGAPAQPVYNTGTGRLELLESDRNGDGQVDTRAFMDGARLHRIEIDRTGDGRVDRWEHYGESPAGGRAAGSTAGLPPIVRAEEASGADHRITRKEFYEKGVLRRVEEDTDANGRFDKWEHYENGVMARIDLDLTGAGFPDRRLIYRRDGNVERVEVDPEGRGQWRLATDR